MIFDTNGLSGWADNFPAVINLVRESARIIIPVIVLGEYEYGVRGSTKRRNRELWLEKVLPACEVVPITATTAKIYTRIAEDLKARGRKIQQNDMWIAACAFEVGIPFVVSNDTGFDYIEGLTRIGFQDPR